MGSLFTGIGGFDLGLERAGFEVKWHSEIDPYCNAVLKKHWPEVPNYGDITKIRSPKYVDLLCGGFPCQDLSIAGKGAGIEGSRSGLWSEFARLRFYERCSQFWESEPNVGRVAHGVPARVDRIRSLGNALVPQIAEFLGRKILAWEESQKA